MDTPLLTIAIPTFNRAFYLNRCLERFTEQLAEFRDEVELLVSNNASTDETLDIVNKYANIYPITYYENEINKGPDFNIVRCFKSAKGKYVWVFGDDDFLLPGRLKDIMTILRNNEVGVIHLGKIWFDKIEEVELDSSALAYKLYKEPVEFIEVINWWITFTTGNIINKSLFVLDLTALEKFKQTSLIQLSWIVPAIFATGNNIVVENAIIACKSNNTGGYKFFKVFAGNFNYILNYFTDLGYDKRMKTIIDNTLLSSFFPAFLDDSNKGFNRQAYSKEKILSLLVPIYWHYPLFWKKVFPSALRYQYPALRKIKQFYVSRIAKPA